MHAADRKTSQQVWLTSGVISVIGVPLLYTASGRTAKGADDPWRLRFHAFPGSTFESSFEHRRLVRIEHEPHVRRDDLPAAPRFTQTFVVR